MNKSSWAIVVNVTNGKVLLGLRSPESNNPNQWNFFGGGVEKSEKPIQTASRELKEELGLKANPKKFIQISKLESSGRQAFYFLLPTSSKLALDNFNQKEIQRVKWFDFNDLPKRLHTPTKRFLKSKMAAILHNELQSKIVKKEKPIDKKTTASTHFLAHIHQNFGINAQTANQILAQLPEGVSLSQIIDILQPVTDNYREQIDDLKAELNWTYQALDSEYSDYLEDISRGIGNYQGAIRALNTYTQSWFAQLPVSYDRLTEIAGYIRSRLLDYLTEADIPVYINQLINSEYDDIISIRKTGFEEPDNLETEEVTNE